MSQAGRRAERGQAGLGESVTTGAHGGGGGGVTFSWAALFLHLSTLMSVPLQGVLRYVPGPLREGGVLAYLRKIQEAVWSGAGGTRGRMRR